MKITPGTEALQAQKPMDPAHFTGRAMARDLIQAAQQATSIFAAVVRFEAGARNHWHSHSGGQLLHVIEGEGWVQVRGQEPERIRLHDTVAADPGEEHWHGAGGHSPMSHLAVAAGETRWLEESPPPPD
ncbi:MAG: cupin domain-containing protein [Chloroflexi bacterium]|nr:MAG: cupin domain-containing protein [Chloroflexota bacterium]